MRLLIATTWRQPLDVLQVGVAAMFSVHVFVVLNLIRRGMNTAILKQIPETITTSPKMIQDNGYCSWFILRLTGFAKPTNTHVSSSNHFRGMQDGSESDAYWSVRMLHAENIVRISRVEVCKAPSYESCLIRPFVLLVARFVVWLAHKSLASDCPIWWLYLQPCQIFTLPRAHVNLYDNNCYRSSSTLALCSPLLHW